MVFVVALPLLAGCGSDSRAATTPKAAEKGPKAVEVRVIAAAEVRMPRTVGVSGTLAADDLVVLSLKVPGRMSELRIDLGSRVKRGQIVARLDPTDYRLRVEQSARRSSSELVTTDFYQVI